MRMLVILGMLLTFVRPVLAEELMTIRDFRDDMLLQLQQTYPDFTFEPLNETSITFKTDGEKAAEGQIFVENSYQLYTVEPDNIDVIMDRVIGRLEDVQPEGPSEKLDDEAFLAGLVLVLRPDTYMDAAPDYSDALVTWPFVADLAQTLAFDSPETLRFVTVAELEEKGISIDQELYERAAANIRVRMGDVYEDSYGSLSLISTENGLGTSYPLLPGVCSAESEDQAFWVIDRETIIRSRLDEGRPGQAEAELRTNAFNIRQSGFGMTNSIATCIDGKWDSIPIVATEN